MSLKWTGLRKNCKEKNVWCHIIRDIFFLYHEHSMLDTLLNVIKRKSLIKKIQKQVLKKEIKRIIGRKQKTELFSNFLVFFNKNMYLFLILS